MSWIPTLALFAMMLALGTTLRPEDFRRLASSAPAVALGLVGQLVLLPLVAFAGAVIGGARRADRIAAGRAVSGARGAPAASSPP